MFCLFVCCLFLRQKLRGGEGDLKFLQALGLVFRGVRANRSQTKRRMLGTLSDLHSTLWKLKASISENVKASSQCILFSLSPAGGRALFSAEETDSNSFPLNPSFFPCQSQPAKTKQNKQRKKQKTLNEQERKP